MSGGQQQMLAVGRALMSNPRLVVFDEISLGLAPVAVETLYEILGWLCSTGVSMLLVEQALERGLSLADRPWSSPTVAWHSTAHPIRSRNHPTLRSLYVGESGEEWQETPTQEEGQS